MKLTELNPKWVTLSRWSDNEHPFYIGITFDCPHCIKQRLAVSFYPPVNPTHENFPFEWRKEFTPFQPVWDRRGETFDTLTLTPSVDTSRPGIEMEGHWHGHIKNGEIM